MNFYRRRREPAIRFWRMCAVCGTERWFDTEAEKVAWYNKHLEGHGYQTITLTPIVE